MTRTLPLALLASLLVPAGATACGYTVRAGPSRGAPLVIGDSTTIFRRAATGRA